MAEDILTFTFENWFSELHYFVAIILVMTFSTADCKRSFAAMNNIKTDSQKNLGEILNELMLLYDMTPKKKEAIDIKNFAKKIAGKWKYDKVNKISWSDAYGVCIVKNNIKCDDHTKGLSETIKDFWWWGSGLRQYLFIPFDTN